MLNSLLWSSCLVWKLINIGIAKRQPFTTKDQKG